MYATITIKCGVFTYVNINVRRTYLYNYNSCLRVSHLADVLPVVIQLEQQEHGAADDQQRQNGRPVHTRHPVTVPGNRLLMTSKPKLSARD